MNLKESFRYQNFLEGLLTTAGRYLSETDYVTTTKREHLRGAASPGAQDETLVVATEKPFDCGVNTLIDFTVHIVDEKELLGAAISAAKKSCPIDIDSAIAMNRSRQNVNLLMERLAGVKSREIDSTGHDYRLNNEGNQTSYVYKIKEVVTIDFDRNKVKGIAKALARKSDEVSAELDGLVLSAVVVYTPKYDINDTFEDVLAAFAGGSETA
ncbi:MAG: hypothetical protein LBN00_12185 [Oscillospiraceae bacterium]|jgi:hypothetical protein|nr:hypothetical protein [Oscillospiraceae bacterium]